MEKIVKMIQVGVVREKAYQKFVNELNEWWPKKYTWSQNKLKRIKINEKKDGLCTEIGPYGFRCDWGRVTKLIKNEQIELKWQISPKREPIPDPDNASDIKITFTDNGRYKTTLKFEHFNFENHGNEGSDYLKMMNAKQGWEYILKHYKRYCNE